MCAPGSSTSKEDLENAPEKLSRVAEKAMQKQGIRIRKMDMRHFDREVVLVKQVYNARLAAQLGLRADDRSRDGPPGRRPQADARPEPDLHRRDRGRQAGLASRSALPDLHQALKRSGGGHYFPFGLLKFLWHRRKINQCRLLIMGMVEEYRGRGADAIFYLETAREALKRGYKRMEGSWILETNTMMNQIIERLGGKQVQDVPDLRETAVKSPRHRRDGFHRLPSDGGVGAPRTCVRVLRRANSKTLMLDGLAVEHVIGDILEPEAVARAVAGCDLVFHVAAVSSYWRAQREADLPGQRRGHAHRDGGVPGRGRAAGGAHLVGGGDRHPAQRPAGRRDPRLRRAQRHLRLCRQQAPRGSGGAAGGRRVAWTP